MDFNGFRRDITVFRISVKVCLGLHLESILRTVKSLITRDRHKPERCSSVHYIWHAQSVNYKPSQNHVYMSATQHYVSYSATPDSYFSKFIETKGFRFGNYI